MAFYLVEGALKAMRNYLVAPVIVSLLQQWTSCQTGHNCSFVCSQLGKIGDYFSPPLDGTVPSSTRKDSQFRMKLPVEYQIEFPLLYDSSLCCFSNRVFLSSSRRQPREMTIVCNVWGLCSSTGPYLKNIIPKRLHTEK